MATAFRNFQSEIEEIHHRELNRQRAQGTAELKERENKVSKGKAKEVPRPAEVPNVEVDQQTDSAEIEERILVISFLVSTCKDSIFTIN